MRPFHYERPPSLSAAVQLVAPTDDGPVDAEAQYLAGGTTLIDLMKLDVLRPKRVIDLGAARGGKDIGLLPDRLRLSAFASMASAADNPVIRTRFPVIAQSLELAASAQLRNMATLGGNVLQRTRCPYFRDPTWTACNKRIPGSGCTALSSPNRNHAILGVDSSCISQYPGDFAVALMALDATVAIKGRTGERRIPFASLHRDAGNRPDRETTLERGEIIAAFEIPATPWLSRSLYLKIRDRASYEFAIASAAVALDLTGDEVREARLGLGGMAYRPWRARTAEEYLKGKSLNEQSATEAAHIALEGAVTHGHNHYKPALARATIVRALLQAKALPAGTSA